MQKRRPWSGVVHFLIDLAVAQRHLLRRIAVRQLLRNDHGTCGSDHAFDGAPADADKIRIDQRVRAVETALVAAVRQSKVGQRAWRARAAGYDRAATILSVCPATDVSARA